MFSCSTQLFRRFGQILGAATRKGSGVKAEKELLTLAKQLPPNRLLTMVIQAIS